MEAIRRAARYATVPLYWLTIAVCVAALVGSLVLWPRSYFYHDYWPLEGKRWVFPSEPAMIVDDEWALNGYTSLVSGGVVSSAGAIGIRNLVIPVSSELPHRAGTILRFRPPPTQWAPTPFPRTVPYWLSLLISCGVLAACAPAPLRARWRVGATRFGLKRLLVVTACAGLLAFGYRGLAVPGVVIAGEAILLAAIGRGAYDQAVACRGAKRWAWFALVLVCCVGIGVLAGFFASNPLTNLATNGMVLPNP